MQKTRWLIVLIAVFLITPLIRADSHSSSVLADADYELENSSREEGPALSSALNAKKKWESYNEWRCFPLRAVELICTEIDYGGWRRSPTIIASSGEYRFEYDLDPSTPWDCDFTLQEWRHIMAHSAEVCLFGAYLQSLDDGASLWVLNRIKSSTGEWVESKSNAYRRAWHKSEAIGSDDREELN